MKQKYAVIFDMGDVLFGIDRWNMIKELGRVNVLKYLLKERRRPNEQLVAHLFEIMYHFGRQPTNGLVATHGGTELPQLTLEWLKGTVHSKKLLEQVKAHLTQLNNEGNCKHYDLLLQLAHVIHNPAIIARHIRPIKPAWDLVKKCHAHRVNVCILSNFDPETFALLQERFGNLFQTYFDEIIISGHVQLAKPDPAIYTLLLKLLQDKYTIPPRHCWFIDDTPNNIESAQQVGIKGLLCANKEFDAINAILNTQLFYPLNANDEGKPF